MKEVTTAKKNYIQEKGIKNHAQVLTRLNGKVDGRRKAMTRNDMKAHLAFYVGKIKV
jgi:hypothetical protein